MTDFMTFKEIANLWLEEKTSFVKHSTISTYFMSINKHIIPHFGNKKRVITEEEVQNYVLSEVSAGIGHKTIKDNVVILKMIYKYGIKNNYLDNVLWDIKYPKPQNMYKLEVLSINHEKKLIKYLYNNFSFRNFGLLLCLFTGIRIGEICALKWGDIDMEQGVVQINKTLGRVYKNHRNKDSKQTEVITSTAKTVNSIREIPISKELMKYLKPIKKIVNNDYYVLSNNTKPLEPRTYRNHYNSVITYLNIPKIKFHGLRHSFATRCIENNCDYKTVSVILGHSCISTTLNLYVHPNKEQKQRCIEKMAKKLF